MYYLLEDNKIVKGTLTPDKLMIKVSFDRGHLFIETERIKKQSDNVYDLIEVGDLVKTGAGKIFDVRKPYIDKGLAIIPFYVLFLNEINITAIYKPNAKGDYIKVWEEEN